MNRLTLDCKFVLRFESSPVGFDKLSRDKWGLESPQRIDSGSVQCIRLCSRMLENKPLKE